MRLPRARWPREAVAAPALALSFVLLMGCGGPSGPPPADTAPRAPSPAPDPVPIPQLEPIPELEPGPDPGRAERAPPGDPGPSPSERPKGAFPSQGDLEQLRTRAAPADAFALDVRDVEAWRLEGPFPERIEARPHLDESPWGTLLGDAARRRAGLVVPTEAMHCAAREVGRFYLEHGAQPQDNLKRFISARCRVSAAEVQFAYIHGDIPASTPEARIVADWQLGIANLLDAALVGGPRTAGIWFGRNGDRTVAMVAAGQRSVLLEPVETRLGDDRALVIEGEVLVPAQALLALIGRGRYGTAPCEPDPSFTLPRFRFVCHAEPGDESAWVALRVQAPARLLSQPAVDVLVWPRGREIDVYRRPSYARSRAAEDIRDAGAGFVELLNETRRKAKLAPVALAPAQSDTATEIAPHFFGAMFESPSEDVTDLVALGMLAGWQVDGIVQEGHFGGTWVAQTDDLALLLSTALEYPVSREVLLAPGVERIAVGPVVQRSDGAEDGRIEALAAVFATYELFSAEAHAKHATAVMERIAALREARRQRPPQRLEEVEPLAMAAASQVQAGAAPKEALELLIRQSVDVLGRSLIGWVAETQQLDELELPEELLAEPDVQVAAGVSFFRPAGEAWGRYVVMLLIAQPEARPL